MNSARTLTPDLVTQSAQPETPVGEMLDLAPWSIIRGNARSIGIALATCLIVLLSIEIGVFRSGFFAAHASISDPQTPAAKLALAARQSDARVLYVGDSTMMTSTLPTVVTATCDCGPGFNAGFSAASPWLTRAMTERLLDLTHPRLVVVDVAPWNVDEKARFEDRELGRQVMSPAELAELGAPLNPVQTIDAMIGSLWSPYGQRLLLKEWVSALAPGQRYDETLRGYYVAPGTANSSARLAAAASRLFESVGEPTVTAPGGIVIADLIDSLRARGIEVAVLMPPLPSVDYEEAGPYLNRADAVIRGLARDHGAPIIDCRSVVSSADFRDATHLLEAGARKHSVCVGNQIRALLED